MQCISPTAEYLEAGKLFSVMSFRSRESMFPDRCVQVHYPNCLPIDAWPCLHPSIYPAIHTPYIPLYQTAAMDPPLPTTSTLPSYLANLSPHTWYNYTSTPALALALEITPSSPKPKPKPPTHILPSDILTLATLLPSTRPLLLSTKFLKALDFTPEETASLAKALSSDKLRGCAAGKRKTKFEQLRERELQLAKDEARDEAKAEKKKEVKRRREIDHVLGLVGKGKGDVGKETYKKPEAITTTTTPAAAATDSEQRDGEKVEVEQETTKQRKRRKIKELDRQLGLHPDKEAPVRPEVRDVVATRLPDIVGSKQTQPANIDTDDAVAIRRARVDILLGLVGNNSTPGDGYESQPEDLRNKAEVTRRRIDTEMNLLNSARMAQMDAILGLLSPRKAGAVRD